MDGDSHSWRRVVGLESKAGGSESRFAGYVEAITSVLGHADRVVPFPIILCGTFPARRSKECGADGCAHAAGTRAGCASVAASLHSEGRLVGRRGARGGARPRAARHREARAYPGAV